MTKIDKRKELLQKALDFLIDEYIKFENDGKSQLILNNKSYKRINFSTYQVEDAMRELATSQNIQDGIPIKANGLAKGTKNNYPNMILDAKKQALENVTKDSFVPSDEITILELKQEIMYLTKKNVLLEEENELNKKIMKKEEIKREFENDKTITIIENEKNTKLTKILEKLLELTSLEYLLKIDFQKGRIPSQVYFEGAENNIKLCNYSDLLELDIEIDNNMIRQSRGVDYKLK